MHSYIFFITIIKYIQVITMNVFAVKILNSPQPA